MAPGGFDGFPFIPRDSLLFGRRPRAVLKRPHDHDEGTDAKRKSEGGQGPCIADGVVPAELCIPAFGGELARKFTKRKGVAGINGLLIGEDVGKGQHEEHKGDTEHRFVRQFPAATAFKSPRRGVLFGCRKRPGGTSVADEPHQPLSLIHI